MSRKKYVATCDLITKIINDTYRVKELFESCTTIEQVMNVLALSNFLVAVKWYNMLDNMHYSMNEWSEQRLWVKSAANDLTTFYHEAKDRVKGNA